MKILINDPPPPPSPNLRVQLTSELYDLGAVRLSFVQPQRPSQSFRSTPELRFPKHSRPALSSSHQPFKLPKNIFFPVDLKIVQSPGRSTFSGRLPNRTTSDFCRTFCSTSESYDLKSLSRIVTNFPRLYFCLLNIGHY